jgi:hypothetical protein
MTMAVLDDGMGNVVTLDGRKVRTRKIFKNPGGSAYIGHGSEGFRQNATWIHLRPYKMGNQPAIARLQPDLKDMNLEFQFLMPNELMESIKHQWQEYECLAGRASQMVGELGKTKQEITGAYKGAGETLSAARNAKSGERMDAAVAAAATQLSSISVYNYRTDAALHYKTSERRNYQINFTLIETGDAWKNNIEIVKTLQQLSAPTQTGNLVGIDVPYVFNISSHPRPWFYIEYAVIDNIQATYKGPFIGGVPSQVDLFLSITDMSPLYDKLFVTKDIINIKSVYGQ